MGLSVLCLPSTGFRRRGYVIEVLAAPLVVWHSMKKESECPCRRFSGLACGSAGQLNGCLSPSEDVGKCFCVGHRTYISKNKKACPCRLATWLWVGGNQDEAAFAGILRPMESISAFPAIRKFGSVNVLRTTTLYEKAFAIAPSLWEMLV